MLQNNNGNQRNLISFREQNLNEKKKLQQFLIQNDISFVLNDQGSYEATIKLTSLEDSALGEGNRTSSPSTNRDTLKQQNKNIQNNKIDINKENKSNVKMKGTTQQDQSLKPNQNNMQTFLNDKINVSSYLNEQRKLSMSPSGGKLRKNSSEKHVNDINNNNNNNKSKQQNINQSKSSATPSRQSNYKKGDNNSRKQSQTPNSNNEANQNQSKERKQNRNYVNKESSPFTTDFSTRWRLNRSRTPESPNIKQHVDVSTSQYLYNRPSSQTSNSKKTNKDLLTKEFDPFKKSFYLDEINQKPQQYQGNNLNKSQKQNFSKENTKNEEISLNQTSQFQKSTKLNFNSSQMIKKNTSKTEQSPEKNKVISLQKVENSLQNSLTKNKSNNQFQINLYEDASAFKNKNSQKQNESKERKQLILNKQNIGSSIRLQNSNQDLFGKSNILEENKNQSKKQNSDTLGQSQFLYKNQKTASFSKVDTSSNNKQVQEENFQTPSGKKKQNLSSKTQFDKYPSSAEIIKNIQKIYMNPVQYPIVEEEHNYSPIQSNFSPKIRSPSQNSKPTQFQQKKQPISSNKSSQSPVKNGQKKEQKSSQQQLKNKSPDISKTNISKEHTSQKRTNNDLSQNTKQKQTKEFTPEKRGNFTSEDFQSKQKQTKEFTPEKRGNFTSEDFFPTPQSKQKQKNLMNQNNISPNPNKNIKQNKEKTPIKNNKLSKSELSMNERDEDSDFKSQQKRNNKKSSLKSQNKSSRSQTPEQNFSQSDISLNDRLSFFKNSRLSNMPDIKLKVKQNHNYSAVLVANDSNLGSRPSSSQLVQFNGISNNSIHPNNKYSKNFLEEQGNYNHNSSQSKSQSADKFVQPFEELDGRNKSKKQQNFNKQISFQQNKQQKEIEPKHFQVNLALDEEESPRDISEDDHDSQQFSRPRSKSNSRGSILLLNRSRKSSTLLKKSSKDKFEQDYFSFNSQNNQLSPSRMLSSSFMNINKNDPWLQVFREDDQRLSNGNYENKMKQHRYTKVLEGSPQRREQYSHQQSTELSQDINVQKLSSNELIHYYQFILEKAKQNQFQQLKPVNNSQQNNGKINE